MILFVKKYHTFSGKVSYFFKKVSYFWLMLWGERAEGVGEETKEERFWHRTRWKPKVSGAAPPRSPAKARTGLVADDNIKPGTAV